MNRKCVGRGDISGIELLKEQLVNTSNTLILHSLQMFKCGYKDGPQTQGISCMLGPDKNSLDMMTLKPMIRERELRNNGKWFEPRRISCNVYCDRLGETSVQKDCW